MASTIQIKNSTTSGNSPSSLTQGELAINVADGNLFYGDGSSVLQRFAITELTASSNVDIQGTLSLPGFSDVSASLAAAGGGSGTVTEVTVGTGLDVANGTTTPNVTLDLTEITLSNGLDSTATGLTLDLSEVGFTGTANGIITSDDDGTVTTHSTLTYSGNRLTMDGTLNFTPGVAMNGVATRVDNQWESTTLESNGEFIQVGTSISRTQHQLYNLGSSGWVAADADASSTSAGLLGVAVNSSTSNNFLIRGMFNVASSKVTSGAIGSVVYVSTTAGYYTCTAPTANGDIVRAVGHIVDSFVSGRTTYWKIYFNPSPDFIEN